MSKNNPQYYRPYESDENDDFDSNDSLESSDSDESEDSDHEVDPRYAILKLAGPALHKNNTDILYANQQRLGAPYEPETNITSFEDHVYLDPPKTIKTTLISIKSINRDKSIFPTPYRFQLKLPRTYKNVTKFQLVQLSFPDNNTNNISQTALLNNAVTNMLVLKGVPSSCISDCVGLVQCGTPVNSVALVEYGRVNSSGEPLLVSLPVTDGSYDDAALAREITFKANCTPPFNIISYDTFRDIFIHTRDILCLFNEPGDGFYSKTNDRRYGSQHTKTDIMNTYYSQHQIDIFPVITEIVAFNAYYFPILKELVATQMAEPFLLLPAENTYSELVTRVMGIFEGLDSLLYYKICTLNRGTLDSYRRYFTFELRNVNRYIVSHQSSESRYHILHDSLHTSIQKDISGRYNTILDQELTLHDLDLYSFRVLSNDSSKISAIYKHLERNLSTVIGQSLFVTGFSYKGGDIYYTSESTIISANDLNTDPHFTTLFDYTSSIGGIYGTMPGIKMTFHSFYDYHSTLSSYYESMISTTTALSSIHGSVNNQYHMYVSTKYNGILPAKMIESQSYTLNQGLPVSFLNTTKSFIPGDSAIEIISPSTSNTVISSHILTLSTLSSQNSLEYDEIYCKALCCSTVKSILNTWYANLPATFVTRTTQYRLGLVNPNQLSVSTFSLTSTVLAMTSTGNLNYLMQINDEQGFNNMDVTMPEDYRVSNGTTGQVKLVCAKILMGQPGDTGGSQTVIQNPSIFENTLGKLDRLDIKIYYDDQDITEAWSYQPFFMGLSEWNATFQVDEEVSNANRATGWGTKPTIPIPKDPDHTPYLFVTHRDNPNNS